MISIINGSIKDNMTLDKNNVNDVIDCLKSSCRSTHIDDRQNFFLIQKLKYYIKKLIYRFFFLRKKIPYMVTTGF